MVISLDGLNLFEGEDIKVDIGSMSRESIERSVFGLDGIVSVDLGDRGRKILQEGVLRARSQVELDSKIAAISAFIDGGSHNLILDSGQAYNDLRMDSFKVVKIRSSGGWISCDYRIEYRQLKGQY